MQVPDKFPEFPEPRPGSLQDDLARGLLLEWAELYALNALPDDDKELIDQAVRSADDSTRRAFMARVWSTREALARSYTAEEAPPAGLFDRITAGLPGQDAAGPAAPAPAAKPDPAPVDELAARRSRRLPSRGLRWLAAGAAAAAIVVGGVSVATNLGQDSLQQDVLQASDLQTRTIDLPTGGTANVATSRGENAAVVTLSGVPAPPDGTVYQMWRVPADGSAPVSVGTMTGAEVAGSKATELKDIDPYSAVAVTVEPDGGSETPTLPVVLVIPFTA